MCLLYQLMSSDIKLIIDNWNIDINHRHMIPFSSMYLKAQHGYQNIGEVPLAIFDKAILFFRKHS